jgi:hypothetical protein
LRSTIRVRNGNHRCSISVARFLTLAFVAVIVVNVFLLTDVVVMAKFMEIAPAGTVMLAGTAAFAGLLLLSSTVTPPSGAGPLRVTVPVAVEPLRTEEGFAASSESTASVDGAGGFTVTTADLLTPE